VPGLSVTIIIRSEPSLSLICETYRPPIPTITAGRVTPGVMGGVVGVGREYRGGGCVLLGFQAEDGGSRKETPLDVVCLYRPSPPDGQDSGSQWLIIPISDHGDHPPGLLAQALIYLGHLFER